MNQKAFINKVMPYKDKMFRLAKRLLISNEEAEDATQETYLKLWNNRMQLETYTNVEAFSMTMIKNYCLDRLKSKQSGNLSLVHSNFSKTEDGLSQNLEIKDAVNRIKKLVKDLPETQRMLIQLRDIEQYEMDEIERITDLNPVTIRVNLSRARKTIREQLISQDQYFKYS